MFWLIFISLLVCLLATLYFYLTRNFNYWKNKGVEFIPPTVGFGNIGPVFTFKKSIWQVIDDLYKKSDSRYTGIYIPDKPALLIRDLDLIKSIFITDFNHFSDRDSTINEVYEPLMGLSLIAMKGQKWRNLRAKMTPTFTSGKMRNMFYLIRECCEKFDQLLQEYVDTDNILEAKSIISRYTMDTIASCAFGIEGQNIKDPDWQLSRTMKKFFNPDFPTTIKQIIMNLTPQLIKLIPGKVLPEDLYRTMDEIIWGTVEYREKNNIRRNDYLDILIEMRKESRKNKDTDIVVDGNLFVSQAFLFFLAGFETSSTMMSLALYELCFHQEIQDKLREEINEVLDKYDREITYDGLKQMTYLDQVINETLRKYPTLPFYNRVCVKDYKVPDSDLVIKKGIGVVISVISLQNDPKLFENPEKFDPDRFSENNISSYHKCSFLPFGEGPRNCIGKRFGLMQSKAALVQILHKYKVVACDSTPRTLVWNERTFVIATKGDLPMLLKSANT